MSKRRKTWKKIKWILVALVALPVILAIIGWFSFQRIPSWYRPMHVARRELDAIRNSLPNTYQALADRAVRGEPFDFAIDARTVTSWIVARDAFYPESRDWLPQWVRDPVVAFDDNHAIIGARLSRDGWEAIVGVHLVADVEHDVVTLRIAKITAGILPIPQDWIADAIRESLANRQLDMDRIPKPLADVAQQLQRDPMCLMNGGLRVENLIDIKNGNRRVSAEYMWTADNKLWLRVQPR